MDQKAFLYQKEGESGFEEKGKSQFEESFWGLKERGVRSRLRDMEERNFFTNIIGSPRIWHPGFHLFDFFERIDELEFPYWAKSFWDRWPRGVEPEPDVFALFLLMLDRARKEYSEEEDEEDELDASEYSQGEIMQYGVRNQFFKDKGFWRISQFFWNPPEPSVFVFSDSALRVSHRELFADEEEEMLDFHSESDSEIVLRALGLEFQLFCMPKWPRKGLRIRWFRRDEDRDQNKARFELLIYRQRQRRFRNKSSLFTNSSLFKGSFHSYTRFESYRYLSNLFLSNGTLLDQMIKALCRKGWIFPEEMKHAIRVSII